MSQPQRRTIKNSVRVHVIERKCANDRQELACVKVSKSYLCFPPKKKTKKFKLNLFHSKKSFLTFEKDIESVER